MDLETIEVLEAVSVIDGLTRWRPRTAAVAATVPAEPAASAWLHPAPPLAVVARRPPAIAPPAPLHIVVPRASATASVLERVTLVTVGLVVGGAIAFVATPSRPMPTSPGAARAAAITARPAAIATSGVVVPAARTLDAPTPRTVALPPHADIPVQAVARPAARTPARRTSVPVAVTPPPARTARLAAGAVPVIDSTAVLAGVGRFTTAYNRLDAAATAAVWPSVDRRQLVSAFTTLREQRLTLRRCVVTPAGSSVSATCVGTLRYRARVGDHSTRTREGPWRFVMTRQGNDWIVERISVP